jgi:hypothetical protein
MSHDQSQGHHYHIQDLQHGHSHLEQPDYQGLGAQLTPIPGAIAISLKSVRNGRNTPRPNTNPLVAVPELLPGPEQL